MSKRLWIALGIAAGAAALSGCVVVPDQPYGYGYGGYGYGAPTAVVRVAPPPVVVTPPPRRYYGWGWHRHPYDRGGYGGYGR